MANEFNGMNVSYDSSELLEEVQEEIGLYGEDHTAYAAVRMIAGVPIVTDYFLFEAELADKLGLAADEIAFKTTLKNLKQILQEQDQIC